MNGVASIDRTIVVLPNGKECRVMPTDLRVGQTQAITVDMVGKVCR